MNSAEALLSGRLTRQTMSWLLVAVLAVTPVEALSTANHLILWTMPVRHGIVLAILRGLRTRRVSPIVAGRWFLAQGVVTTTFWTLVLDSSPARAALEATAYGSILSILALLIAPRDQRRRWSFGVTAIILVPAAVKLLPQDVTLLAQVVTILAVHGLAVIMLDVCTDRAEAQGRMASIDPLTGLFNRRPTLLRLTDRLGVASAGGATASALILDLDHFKDLNDTLGHEAGDDALCSVGSTLRSLVGANDVVCRWGGEEFLVLLPDTDGPAAVRTAEAFRTAIAQTGVTASIGVAEVRPGETVAAWGRPGRRRHVPSQRAGPQPGRRRLGRNRARGHRLSVRRLPRPRSRFDVRLAREYLPCAEPSHRRDRRPSDDVLSATAGRSDSSCAVVEATHSGRSPSRVEMDAAPVDRRAWGGSGGGALGSQQRAQGGICGESRKVRTS